MDGLSIKTLQELGQDSHQNISVAGYKGAWVGSHVSGFFFFWRDWFFISKRHLSIFSIKTVTLLGFFSPNWSPKRPHRRRDHFKPITLQDAHLTDLTETSSKKGDWVGKET